MNDIRKYATGLDAVRIQAVFDSIAPQLAKENKKFQLAAVARGARCNLGTWKGGLFENIGGETLAKSGAELFYYKRENAALEMDFFLPRLVREFH